MEEYLQELNKTHLNRGSEEDATLRREKAYKKLDTVRTKAKRSEVRDAADSAFYIVANAEPGTRTLNARSPHYMVSKRAWVLNR